MAITDNIRNFRDQSNLTQEMMAEKLGTTRSNYAYLESRGEKLTIEQLQSIADALGKSVVQLLTSKENPISTEEPKRIQELRDRIIQSDEKIQNLKAETVTLRQSLDTYNFMFKMLIEQIQGKEPELREAFETDGPMSKAIESLVEGMAKSGKLSELEKMPNPLDGN